MARGRIELMQVLGNYPRAAVDDRPERDSWLASVG